MPVRNIPCGGDHADDCPYVSSYSKLNQTAFDAAAILEKTIMKAEGALVESIKNGKNSLPRVEADTLFAIVHSCVAKLREG